jgi:predicted site-specific integrase-resolvase
MKIAIYSRKSIFAGKGDSIENQISMCQEYIYSKLRKDVEVSIYKDKGFTGKNTNRPELQRLMKDIKNKQIDLINLTYEHEIKEILKFLREREVIHYQRFGDCLKHVQDVMFIKK